MSDCPFCSIVDGEIEATVVHESDRVIAFRDISPQAPVHLVVIPKEHYVDIGVLAANDQELAGELLAEAAIAAAEEGYGDEFRLVFNTGADAGQTVLHVHAHVLAGRGFTWPPG
jgi:histidine triad (HIT) family protein